VTPLRRQALAEFLGTALLLLAVVGSGAAAQRLSADPGLQLLENALATAAALVAIILAFGPVSGAQLNPAVTLATRAEGDIGWPEAGAYIAAQVAGGAVGTIVANMMFSLPAVELSTTARSSGALWLGEAVATFGLVLLVLSLARSGRTAMAPWAVGAYIGGAYFFTSSSSVANPAATVARTLTDTFVGIASGSAPAFVVAQLTGAAVALAAARAVYPHAEPGSGDRVLPHPAPPGVAGRGSRR